MSQEHGSREDLGSPTEPDSDLQVRYEEAIDAMRRGEGDAASPTGEAADCGPIRETGADPESAASEGPTATCELVSFHVLHVMLIWVAPVPAALSGPEFGEEIVIRSSDSRKRQKVRGSREKIDPDLQKNRLEMEDDAKRTLQLQNLDAADNDPGSPTDCSRPETPGAGSDQQAPVPSVDSGRRKRRRSGEGALERPLKSRKPQEVLPLAERGGGRGREKADFDWGNYIQSLEDQRENIAPVQVFYDDGGRVVGTWRGSFRTNLPGYRFKTFYGSDRTPSVGSLDPSMRRTDSERLPEAGQCEPSQTADQRSRMSTTHSTTASRTVASGGKAETGGSSISGDTAVDYRRSIAGAEQASPEPAGSKERG